jgi:hypothetical protein
MGTGCGRRSNPGAKYTPPKAKSQRVHRRLGVWIGDAAALSFYGYALGQVAGLIDVGTAPYGHVVGKELQGQHR